MRCKRNCKPIYTVGDKRPVDTNWNEYTSKLLNKGLDLQKLCSYTFTQKLKGRRLQEVIIRANDQSQLDLKVDNSFRQIRSLDKNP